MKKTNFKLASYLIITIILTLGLSISFQAILADWTAPTADPPGSNVSKPINESSENQVKQGGLGIGSNFLVGTDAFYVNEANGNVGIGTTTLQANLDITAGGSDVLARLNIGHSTTNSTWLRLTEEGFRGGFLRYDNATNDFHIGVHDTFDYDTANDIVAITVDRVTGNVGIGTASPNEKLEVNGNLRLPIVNCNGVNTLDTDANGNIVCGADVGGGPGDGYIELVAGDGTHNAGDDLDMGTYTLSTSGNVGIGTDVPSAKLEIDMGNPVTVEGLHITRGAAAAFSYLNIEDESSAPIFKVHESGNVGIGDTTPSYKLDVSGTLRATSDIRAGDDVIFNGDLMPDGAACADSQILQRTAANNWDCVNMPGAGIACSDCDSRFLNVGEAIPGDDIVDGSIDASELASYVEGANARCAGTNTYLDGDGNCDTGYLDADGTDATNDNDDIAIKVGNVQIDGSVYALDFSNGFAGTAETTSETRIDLSIGSCSAGSSIRAISASGGVTCETDDTGAGIPSGLCMFKFSGSCPSGWSRNSALDSRTIRGASIAGGTGGSGSHTHTGPSHTHTSAISGFGGVGGGGWDGRLQPNNPGNAVYATAAPQTGASGTGVTSSTSSWPPYANVIVCCKD